MPMRSIPGKLAAVLLAALTVQASAREGWLTDLEAAKKSAAAQGKDILIEFTRSEGCGWCIKLEKEVLSLDAFKERVAKQFVLVTLDFPLDQGGASAGADKRKQALLRRYRVRTFPYLVACDAAGLPYAGAGYRRGAADDYIDRIAALPERRRERDRAFAEAEKLTGAEKARMLEKGLAKVSRRYHRRYPEVIAAIAKADPSDAGGFVSRVRLAELKSDIARRLAPLYRERKFAEIPAAVDAIIRERKPEGEALQTALLFKVQALYVEKNYSAVAETADRIIAINDSSRAARFARMLKKRVARLK